MKRIIFLIQLMIFTISIMNADELYSITLQLNGTSIYAQDDSYTFLVNISSRYDVNSIYYRYGLYGNKYPSTSIWNKYIIYGSQYSLYSLFNRYSNTPPLIVLNERCVSYLSVSNYLQDSISPELFEIIEEYF